MEKVNQQDGEVKRRMENLQDGEPTKNDIEILLIVKSQPHREC